MKRLHLFRTILLVSVLVGLVAAPAKSHASSYTLESGTLNGVAYEIYMPENWNGTLLLDSHGYGENGEPLIPQPPGISGMYMVNQGYAHAASAFSSGGWDIEQALPENIDLLDYFTAHYGAPTRTIAWGGSLGGMISAGLVQRYPARFSGALLDCGVVGGGIAPWNAGLDATFVVKTLLAPGSGLQLTGIQDPDANLALANQILDAAQQTPEGRARLALAAAMMDVPGWWSPVRAEPAAEDYATRQFNQYLWLRYVDSTFFAAFRAELEGRAGGNPSWNTGVDYRVQLARSSQADLVRALYLQAGLSLEDDLTTLQNTARISADAGAVAYLDENISFTGQIQVPVLTMHTTGDGLVPVEHEQAYDLSVSAAGNEPLLRQTFVQRAGHCAFTPAELVTALQTLTYRLDTGQWDSSTNPEMMNEAATALGPTLNRWFAQPMPAAFIHWEPSAFPRPYPEHP